MTSYKPIGALLALMCAWQPAIVEAADDVATLRAELQALKSEYAARVGALEARIGQLESAPAFPVPAPEPASATGARSSATAFNPAISLILAATYTSTSRDPGDWGIGGFIPSGGEVGPGERSFSLGESELALTSNVDPYFSATLIAAIAGEDEIGVEEAYFRTLALPSGFTAKGGRFFSSLGYLNEVHAHAWDFADQPLVYQAFFGNQLAQDGLQVKWLAPTNLFIELGAEGGNGQAFPGTRRNRNALNGGTLFAHVGGDAGERATWRGGVSWLEQHAEDRSFEDVNDAGDPVLNAFTGTSRTWVADATLKWAPTGNSAYQQLKVQGEYVRRKESGELSFDAEGLGIAGVYRSRQSGWYLQSVFQFRPRWRAGLRYDALDSGSRRIAADPERTTLMLDWNPSEFSRLRAQYAWDDARASGDRDRQFRLQYLFGIGAHGAHKY
ncbi:MAG TPA: TonB-dependent receptor [Steroidobacteraceae bacterium]|nr:TonB-dependent receptor [Steroidobacteraceae bacterium]